MSWFRVQKVGAVALLYVGDEIGFSGELTDLLYQLEPAREVELFIDSSGGCALTAQKLVDAIRGKTTVATITGTCASAAVLIAMAARRIRIVRDGQVMLHPARQWAFASAQEMRGHVQALDAITNRMVDAIAKRTADPDLARLWLTDGRDFWMDSDASWNCGLVDEVFDRPTAPRRARKSVKAQPEPVAMPVLDEQQGNGETLIKFLTAFGPVETSDPQKLLREVHAVLMNNLRIL